MPLPVAASGRLGPAQTFKFLLQPLAFSPPAGAGFYPGGVSFFLRSSVFGLSLWRAFASHNGFVPSFYLSKGQGARTPTVLRPPEFLFRLFGLKFYHILGLKTFGTLGYIKLHRLLF